MGPVGDQQIISTGLSYNPSQFMAETMMKLGLSPDFSFTGWTSKLKHDRRPDSVKHVYIDKYLRCNIQSELWFFCISVLIETFLPGSKIKEQAEFEDKKCDLARVGPLLKYKHWPLTENIKLRWVLMPKY